MTGGATRVLVVTDDEAWAARIEADLRGEARYRVRVGAPGALERLFDEDSPAIVVLATTATRLPSALVAIEGLPRVPPLVLLVDDLHTAWTPAARRAGARAILDRQASREELRAAIGAVSAGLIALHPDVFGPPPPSDVERDDEDRALTAREIEILEMLAEGLSNQAIARRLKISRHTVKFHVAAILAKLRAHSRTEAVTLGVRRGLISL